MVVLLQAVPLSLSSSSGRVWGGSLQMSFITCHSDSEIETCRFMVFPHLTIH